MLVTIAHVARHLHSHGELPVGALALTVIVVALVAYLATRGAGR